MIDIFFSSSSLPGPVPRFRWEKMEKQAQKVFFQISNSIREKTKKYFLIYFERNQNLKRKKTSSNVFVIPFVLFLKELKIGKRSGGSAIASQFKRGDLSRFSFLS